MTHAPDTEYLVASDADGLSQTPGSIAYEAKLVDSHLHNYENWLGAAAVPVGETHVADSDSMTAFQITSGNDTWGAWVQVAGSADTPVRAGNTYIDIHRILVSDVSVTASLEIVRMQLTGGDSGAAGLASGDYTEFMIMPEKGGRHTPVQIISRRFPAGTKGWARLWVKGLNAQTLDFFIGTHEYEG